MSYIFKQKILYKTTINYIKQKYVEHGFVKKHINLNELTFFKKSTS